MSAVLDYRSLAARFRPVLGDGSSILIVSHVAQLFLRVGSSMIVTRLLSPDAYGIIGIVTSVSYFLSMVSDMGLRAFIIRHEHSGDELIQSVWTVRFIRNAAIFLIMFLSAGAFASLYSAPEVTTAIRVCAALFLVDATSSFSLLLTERYRGVIRLTAIEFGRFLLVMFTTIAAAYFLRNYWAIIVAMFANSLATIAASHLILKGPPIRFRLDPEHVRDLWGFWRIIIPASMITIILTQTNIMVIARFFSISELGRYTIATTLAGAVLMVTQEYVIRVFFPRFAEVNRESAVKAKALYYDARRHVVLFFAFGIGGLLGGGELLIRILYNDEYLGAGLYLALLCINPLVRLSSFTAEQAIVTKGFIKVGLIANVVRLAWVFSAGPIAYLNFGPLALITVFCLAEAAALPYFLWQLRRYDLLDMKEELLILLFAIVGAAIGYACYWSVEALIAAGHIPSF